MHQARNSCSGCCALYDHAFACACVTSENKALLAVDSRRSLKETLIAGYDFREVFTGVEPMGLFWSLSPVTDRDRDDLLRKRDVRTPLKVTLDVYSVVDEGNLEERDKQTSVTLLRCYMGAGLSRCFLDSHNFMEPCFSLREMGPFQVLVSVI